MPVMHTLAGTARSCVTLMAAAPLLAGFLLDLALGDPYSLPHPVRAVGSLISRTEKVIRKRFAGNLRLGGTILAAIVSAAASGGAFAALYVSYRINVWLGIAVESVMCYYLIAPRCLRDESMKVCRALEEQDIEKARKAVSMIVGRDTAPLDGDGITRAAVETVAENTSDGVTAPLLYIALGGAALGFFYKAVNTMDSMIGYRNEKYVDLGRSAAKLDDAVNFLPSRITAVVMIVSAYLLRYDGRNAFRIWRRDRKKHESPNSAQTESVCAGALDIRLGGDAYYFGKLHRKEYIGDDLRPVEAEDIRRANRLMYGTSLAVLALSVIMRVMIWRKIWL